MYVLQILKTLLSSASVTVGTAAIQISGGQSPLYGLSTAPSDFRQTLRVTNTGTTNIYLGSVGTITSANGGGWSQVLAPGQYFDDLISGSFTRYAVSSATGGSITIEELQ